MPELREARKLLAQAQREVVARTKAVHTAELALAVARTSRGKPGSIAVAKSRAALTKASSLLKSANLLETQASRALAKVIASEAARVSAETRARTLVLYREKLERKTAADLEKAVAGFIAAWTQHRERSNARKLARMTKKAGLKEAQSRKKANAKARAAVDKAAALTKARARRAAVKASAKAARLKVHVGR